jgi:hypothetical protein
VPCAVRIARSPRAVRSGAPRHAARAAAALAFPGQSSVLLCHADAAGGRTEMMRLFVHAGDWIARRMQGPNPNSANLSGCPQARGWQSVRASAARSPSRREDGPRERAARTRPARRCGLHEEAPCVADRANSPRGPHGAPSIFGRISGPRLPFCANFLLFRAIRVSAARLGRAALLTAPQPAFASASDETRGGSTSKTRLCVRAGPRFCHRSL